MVYIMPHTFKRLFSAIEAAEILMKDWDDVDDNEVELVMLPPEKVDALTDDEEVDENGDKLGNTLPKDVAGSIEIDTNCDIEVSTGGL